jgi:phosphoribosyl-ATP pyrophosphohydrolase/phosphoribosyl-AMP cyclohydrolase
MTALGDLDWGKNGGLIPVIVQNASSGAVLMLGYMNCEALSATQASGHVTFWSRRKKRLWTKGETSGNTLQLRSIAADCDGDALLVLAEPIGPACHLGTPTCWGISAPRSMAESLAFLGELEELIAQRMAQHPANSYTAQLLAQGTLRVAQKVGEEGLELALAGAAQSDERTIAEAADLLYHVLVLLRVRNQSLAKVIDELTTRHASAKTRDSNCNPNE